MNTWIDATEKLPPLTQPVDENNGFSDQVVIWMVEDEDDLDNGILSVGTYHYNDENSEWLGDDLSYFIVTHWMPIESPNANTGYTLYFNTLEERILAENELKRAGIPYWNNGIDWAGNGYLTVQNIDVDQVIQMLSDKEQNVYNM